jgi:hypothetical protein
MMNTTIRHRAHRGVAVAVLAASLAGCAAEDTGDRSPPTSTAPAVTPSGDPTAGGAVPTDPTGAVRIRLPRQLSIEGARREFDYQVGELAYWPPGNEIAIFYADDGQTIPQPGLVRLGSIDSGLEVIAAAGNDFQLTIEPLD